MKKTLRILIYLVLITCLLFVLSVMLVPRFTGLQLNPLVGRSMEPAIADGALVAMGKVDPAQIKVGDIIGFSVAGIDTPVCHRVVEIVQTREGYGFLTRGDGNLGVDEWVVGPQDVFGKVYFDTSWLAPLASSVGTPPGFILLRVLPVLTVLGLLAIEVRLLNRRLRAQGSIRAALKVY